jgi:2-polyprenyl-3-methyl-5-hydroxy-6-metoxy-1,4-benzoquinol methylase
MRICHRCNTDRLTDPDFLSTRGHCAYCAIEDGMERAFPKGSTVLDVGSGMAIYHKFLHAWTGGELALLDAHLPYMVEHRPPEGIPLVIGDMMVTLPMLMGGVFDAVTCIDVIEHLEKRDAFLAIEQMKRIAPVVCVLTPNDVHPQSHDPYMDRDGNSLKGDHWQTHRSTWYRQDLESAGFEVELWENFHRVAGHGKSPHALWGTWKRG